MNLSKLRASINLTLMLLVLCTPSGVGQAPVTRTPPSGGGERHKEAGQVRAVRADRA